jgi:hypothetical protein
MRLRHQHAQPHRLDRRDERLLILMLLPARVQPFLRDNRQLFAQRRRVRPRSRCGVSRGDSGQFENAGDHGQQPPAVGVDTG